MEKEIKIENLRIGQKIWIKGEEKTIIVLSCGDRFIEDMIYVQEEAECYYINQISLTPPKQKKRYWQWKIKDKEWFRADRYFDENGNSTIGGHYIGTSWHLLDKIKIEDDYVEVEG